MRWVFHNCVAHPLLGLGAVASRCERARMSLATLEGALDRLELALNTVAADTPDGSRSPRGLPRRGGVIGLRCAAPTDDNRGFPLKSNSDLATNNPVMGSACDRTKE